MATIRIKTHIDITDTGVRHKHLGTEKQFQQNSNFTTFQQILGLRSNFRVIKFPHVDDGTWEFDIEIESDVVYDDGKDPVGLLKQDFNGIPIISGLDETKKVGKTTKVSKPGPNVFIEWLG